MCGLVGVISASHKYNYEKFFKQALVADTLRGFHSTGAVVAGEGEFSYFKSATHAVDFTDMGRYDNLMRDARVGKPVALLGHNRAATVGKVNADNAHPFPAGDLIGMHNGTLRKYNKLCTNTFATDSECLYNHIAEHGIHDALNKIEGAYCLVWYDVEKDHVYVVRNDERPLAMAKIKNEPTLLYASEAGMLRWLAGRNGLEIEEVWEPKKNYLFTFKMYEKDLGVVTEQLNVVSEYPAPVKNPSNYGSYGRSLRSAYELEKETGVKIGTRSSAFMFRYLPYTTTKTGLGKCVGVLLDDPWLQVVIHGLEKSEAEELDQTEVNIRIKSLTQTRWGDDIEAIAVVENEVKKPKAPSDEPGQYEIQDLYRGPDNQWLTEREMDKLCDKGCAMCGDPIDRDDYELLEFHSNDNVVCPFCVDEWVQTFGMTH